ncbi:hypothetical protein SAMN06264364_1682 [Quadrisphaera granulorum]|uniref:Uncharacterized protein n=1 Tax=Quadrisphaera granulorum TaxID=317664 RepID=A0A315ZAS3_9ACTN|nr:hypothetical protein [Quadrisphaera granulorum]PWJ42450.1 hypothetical protein BXY45_1682 [Quadrisphaera granulorum]SZE99225.1 hypothetical protein SAMN06264364_1682 [Quadrisphaera granulorum]
MSTATSPDPQHEGQNGPEHEERHAAEHEGRRRESWEYGAVHEVLVDEHTDGIADPASRIEHERGRPFAPEPTPDPGSEPIPDPMPDLVTSPSPAGGWDPAPFPHF